MLQPAINVGISESDFWNMTVAEVQRAMEGAVWRMKSKAQFDYSLANMIGFSVSRLLDSNAEMPTIEEIYPDLFQEEIKKREEEEAEALAQEAAARKAMNNFMQFALKHNARMHGEGVEQDKL